MAARRLAGGGPLWHGVGGVAVSVPCRLSNDQTFQAVFGRAQRFDLSTGPDGAVRAGVWDRFCTLGQKIKEGEESVFDEATLGQMVENWYVRGGRLAMCQDHKSAATPYVSAPALTFYDAMAIVVGGSVVLVRKLVESAAQAPELTKLKEQVQRFATEDNPEPSAEGLWGWRSEVTPLGQDDKEGLRNYRGLSPMFVVDGKDEQDQPIGYVLFDVAATNTAFQAGCEITFARLSAGGGIAPEEDKETEALPAAPAELSGVHLQVAAPIGSAIVRMSGGEIETVHTPSYKVGDRVWRGGEDNPLEVVEVVREGTTGKLQAGKWVSDWLYRVRDAKGREARMWLSKDTRKVRTQAATPPLKSGDRIEYRDRMGTVRRGRIITAPDVGAPGRGIWVTRDDNPDLDAFIGWTDVVKKLSRRRLARHHTARPMGGHGVTIMKILQKLGVAESASVAQKMARYGAYVFSASTEELAEMASDLDRSGDHEAKEMATKLRRFAGADDHREGDVEDDDGGDPGVEDMAALARKLGIADASPDEVHEALGRFAQTCKLKFAEAMEDPAALASVLSEVDDVLTHGGGEHLDAYAAHFEGLKRLSENMKRFAGEPVDSMASTVVSPASLTSAAPAASAAPASLGAMASSADPEGDAIVHAFAQKRGIDLRRTPRAVILGAMVAAGTEHETTQATAQATIDARVQAAFAAEKLRVTRAENARRANELFTIATKCGFAKEAKAGFMTMARGNIADAELFVNSLPGAKALTRMTVGGAPIGATNGVTPQAGLRPGGEDARVNVELADRAQQLVDKAKTDPQTMSRLTKLAGTNAHPGMLLAAAQKIVADESPEIVEWAQPSSSPLLGLV